MATLMTPVRIDDSLQRARITDVDVALVDGDDAIVCKFGERAAHRFQRQPQIAAYFLTGHAQDEVRP